MKLLTQEIRNTLPKLYSQEKVTDPMVLVKYFTPDSSWTWYVIEGEKLTGEFPEPDDFRFFGLVDGFEEELGYFLLSELEGATGPMGLHIERDLYWTPKPLSKVRK